MGEGWKAFAHRPPHVHHVAALDEERQAFALRSDRPRHHPLRRNRRTERDDCETVAMRTNSGSLFWLVNGVWFCYNKHMEKLDKEHVQGAEHSRNWAKLGVRARCTLAEFLAGRTDR